MHIGRFHITRVKKTAAGLTVYPWQALTEDRVTPELRQIIAKVVRSEAKSHFQRLQEEAMDGGRPECTGPHQCRYGAVTSYCKESCTACSGDNVRPCYARHVQGNPKDPKAGA
jgi:hypothetical protein